MAIRAPDEAKNNDEDSINKKNYTSGGTSWLDKCTVSFLVVVFDRDHMHSG